MMYPVKNYLVKNYLTHWLFLRERNYAYLQYNFYYWVYLWIDLFIVEWQVM